VKLTEKQQAELDGLVSDMAEDIDTYRQTVEAVYAFAHISLWDAKAKQLRSDGFFAPGLPMVTSESNVIEPSTEITPDLVLGVTDAWGIVAEAKKSLSREVAHWGEDLRDQLLKYDDELCGWLDMEGPRKSHSVTLLVHNSRKVDVRDYLSGETGAGRFCIRRPFAIVVYHRVDELKKYINLETYQGGLGIEPLNTDLGRPVQVLLKHLRGYQLHFSDQPPPLPYTMAVVWHEVVADLPPVSSYQTTRATATRLLVNVNVEEMTEVLQDRLVAGLPMAPPRLRSVPRRKWIKDALEALVRYRHARRAGADDYVVEYRNIRDPLTGFIQKHAREQLAASLRKSRSGDDGAQLKLFDMPLS
jgi:hypothetical protein